SAHPTALCRSLSGRQSRCSIGCIHLPFRNSGHGRVEAAPAQRRHSHEVAMLIPSIDLMRGKIVQLVQGERKALEFDDFDQWAERFSTFSIVQLVDLDAAKGSGNNNELVRYFAGKLRTQIGGGIRSIARAREVLGFGASKVIVGSALFPEGEID